MVTCSAGEIVWFVDFTMNTNRLCVLPLHGWKGILYANVPATEKTMVLHNQLGQGQATDGFVGLWGDQIRCDAKMSFMVWRK